MFRKRILAGVVVMALLLALAAAGVAFAGLNPQAGAVKANLYQDFVAKFAANLGVGQDQVTAALEATKKQMLDEAVQKGYLTQEQADKIAARESWNFGWFGRPQVKKQGLDDRGSKFRYMGKGAEEILGMTPDQLKAELKSGKSWEQVLSDRGLTIEQFRQKMLEKRQEALAKAVSEGKITQEQADKMIRMMEQRKNKLSPGASQ